MAGQKSGKRVPNRLCIACREPAGKRDLIRIVRSPTGVKIDPSGKMAGRGAYLHPISACWEIALERGAIARALRTRIRADEVEQIREYALSLARSESG